MDEENPRQSQSRSGTRNEGQSEGQTNPTSPLRTNSTVQDDVAVPRTRSAPTGDQPQEDAGLRQRTSTARRRSGSGVPSLHPRSTLAQRTQGKFTLAGPEETPQLRLAQEPFVSPGYSDLNPAYDQPNNTKPVWSLAKPLPRVVRPGMVPTKDELLQARANAQLPAENSQKEGLDVDPNKLELGQIDKSADLRKMAAQVEDARLQRENNFMNKVLSGDARSSRPGSRLSRTTSGRVRRTTTRRTSQQLPTLEEQASPRSSDAERRQSEWRSDEPLEPLSEAPDSLTEEEEEESKIPFADLDSATCPEDLHPLVQDLVEDEIHNNHTTWSVIRTHHREALAEALAVYVQLTTGFCADLTATISVDRNPNTTSWAWGFATMMGIYISGGVSGAHLNPAITLMLWFYRGFPKRKMPEYFAAQFIGAFCAGLTAYGLYLGSIQYYLSTNIDRGIVNSFVTNPRQPWIGPAAAFFNEFLGTTFLVVTVLALGDDQNAPPGAGMNSLIIGLMITALSMTFSYQTGAAFNPSRDFGPRLALLALGYPNELFLNPYWFYGPWVGATSGAFMGAFLYDFMIFTGGESPVNYPWERTQRAMKKSRMKWKRRLHLARRQPQDATVP